MLVVVGGATRSDSVRAGLAVVPDDVDVVVVHDAARPLASRRLFDLVVHAVVNGGSDLVGGPDVMLQVTSVVPTNAGRLVFARLDDG